MRPLALAAFFVVACGSQARPVEPALPPPAEEPVDVATPEAGR